VKDVKGSNTTKGMMRYDDRAGHIVKLESIEKGQATLMFKREVRRFEPTTNLSSHTPVR
jgi:hypothetical protein